MPLTFPAHQAFVLPLKFWRPRAVDATALFIGSAAPDLGYALGPVIRRQSHTALGVVLFAVPLTLLLAWLVRRWVALSLFASVPDAGRWRFRSYRVLAGRRPSFLTTLTCAFIGAGSHVIVDGFTHRYRWGANWLGLNDVIGTVPLRGEFAEAAIIQYLGHTVGSAFTVWLLWRIGRDQLLGRWYGTSTVEHYRGLPFSGRSVGLFWLVLLGVWVVSTLLYLAFDQRLIFSAINSLVLAIMIAGIAATPRCR